MVRKAKHGVTVVDVEFQNYVFWKVEELLTMKGGFPDVDSVVNYAIMYAFGGGEIRFLNEYRAEHMNDELAEFL
jgi:hypothetical protein